MRFAIADIFAILPFDIFANIYSSADYACSLLLPYFLSRH